MEQQTLLGEPSSKIDWRPRIMQCLTLLLLLSIGLFVVIGSVVTIFSLSRFQTEYKKPLIFEDLYNPKLKPKTFNYQWGVLNGTETFFHWNQIKTENQTTCSLKSEDGNEIITDETLKKFDIPCFTNFKFSKNEKYAIFKLQVEQIYRHSALSKYKYFDFKNATEFKELTPLKQSYASFCPNDENKLIYVENNDIYLFDIEKDTKTRITQDGVPGLIYNGVTDWLYEEEVYGTDHTLIWSESCESFAFLKLNDTNVPIYKHTMYKGKDNTYPEVEDIRYPKPGETNPTVSIFVWKKNNLMEMKIEDPNRRDYYIYDLNFKDDDKIIATYLNRQMNKKEFIIGKINQNSIEIENIIQNKYQGKPMEVNGWIAHSKNAFFFKENYIDIVPFQDRFHVGLFDLNGNLVKFLENTTKSYDVSKLFKTIYNDNIFMQITGDTPAETKVIQINIISNEMIILSNSTYLNTDIDISPFSTLYMLKEEGPDVPKFILKNTKDHSILRVLEDNKELKKERLNYSWQSIEFIPMKFSDESTEKDYTIETILQKPYNFNSWKKYKLLIFVYGGPGSQIVTKKYSTLYSGFTSFFTTENIVVLTIDTRGTRMKGEYFMKQVYKNLGDLETKDVVKISERMKQEHSWVDKIIVYGWSYGGYVSLLTAFTNKNTIDLAISGAPVTDWIYYDTGYTERYMLQPKENESGYKNSSCFEYINENSLKFTKLMLIHGLGDDNVHPIHSFHLMTKLQNYGILYDSHFYKDLNHGFIRDINHNSTRQLYKAMIKAIKNL